MIRAAVLLFFFTPFLLQANSDSSSTSRFLLSMELQEGMERAASFLVPAMGLERGRHRLNAGAVFGRSYLVVADSRGGKWKAGGVSDFRGMKLAYGLRVWSPSERVDLRGGLSLYYFADTYRAERGDIGPEGKEYGVGHDAERIAWAGAPYLDVELELGGGFSIALGLQPLRYEQYEYRWESDRGGLQKGNMQHHRFLRQELKLHYRPGAK